MEVKGNINIESKRLSVAYVISESFVYETSDMTSHGISIDMTSDGVVTIKIDGSINSSYKKEILDSHVTDSHIEKLYQRLIGAYEKVTTYYYRMYVKPSKVRQKSDIKSLINNLECKKYEESPFDIKKPEISEIEEDLKIEAKGENFESEAEIEKYIASHIEDCYNYRIIKWENLKKYHHDVQEIIAEAENKKFQEQYESRKKALHDIISGDAEYFKKKMDGLKDSMSLPFPTELEYMYNPEEGLVEIVFDSPSSIPIPQKKVCISKSGKQEIVKTTPEENVINQTKNIIAVVFYIASSIWNISTRIKTINITNWQIRNQVGRCWFSFERDSFAKLDLESINVIEACKNVKHVFDLKNYILQPMRAKLFEYAINEGHYDDSTLLKYVNKINSIEKKSYNKNDVETLQVENDNNSPSINNMDYGYDLSKKPYFDKSFANWCYKLIKYEKCSLDLFIKDFGWSLDRAKDYMEKLLYLHFVGGKDSAGERKVLIDSENELEYKLSWIYPNDSWKY